MQRRSLATALFFLFLAWAPSALALPRFAARTGNECIQCHVNPGGGGMRNSYGRNVFERTLLALNVTAPAPGDGADGATVSGEAAASEAADGATADGDPAGPIAFSGDVNEWLALGADFRSAYIWTRPDRGPLGSGRRITNSFFLMESYLYLGATLNEHATFMLQLGVYTGFEAWGLFRVLPEPAETNLLVKVGRFMPTFGIRDVEHQLYTRAGIGLGNADRDTGIEVTGYAGPFTLSVAVVNGTFGNTPFDSSGFDRRTFEKAVVSRLSYRLDTGWLRAQVGGSFYYNDNVSTANPLFTGMIPDVLQRQVGLGVSEVRAGAFLAANIGRFTYIADFVFVRDEFNSTEVLPIAGYASYQEVSFLAMQGLDVLATLEFMDRDLDLERTSATRVALAIEFFPWTYTELRAMVRRSWDDTAPTGGAWDVVLFAHLFM